MAKIINGEKRYPFAYLKHDHKILTYIAECDIAIWDAEKAGDEATAEKYRERRAEASELNAECHRYMDNGGRSWLKGPSIGLAKDIVGGYLMRGDAMGYWKDETNDPTLDEEY